MTKAIAIALLLASSPSSAQSVISPAAASICAQAASIINALADFTRTDCTPVKDGDGYGLLFVSLDAVFANEQSKKAYLLVLVGAAGAAINSAPRMKITRVTFMDKHLGRQSSYFSIPARETARLQREIKADRMTLEAFYAGILRAGAVRPTGGAK
jgi:hypothetical protein